MIKKVYSDRHVQHPVFLSDLNHTWNFSTDFQKILKYKISRKSAQWESGVVPGGQTDGRADMTKLTVAESWTLAVTINWTHVRQLSRLTQAVTCSKSSFNVGGYGPQIRKVERINSERSILGPKH